MILKLLINIIIKRNIKLNKGISNSKTNFSNKKQQLYANNFAIVLYLHKKFLLFCMFLLMFNIF